MIELKKSPVIFDEPTHTYTLDGVILSGVTSMLTKMIFKDKYSGVPKNILDRAAQHGSYVHHCLELADTLGVDTQCPEVTLYQQKRDELGYEHIASEFLISDEENIASSIDKVFMKNGNIYIGDAKTTYKLDEEYLSWQLSIYAYLFEKQTKIKVKGLIGIWLRDNKAKFIPITRKSDSSVKKLIKCYVDDTPFEEVKLPVRKTSQLPDQYAEIEGYIEDIMSQYAYWMEEKKKLTEGVMKEMVKRGDYKWEGDCVTFIRKKDSIRTSFDAASFQREHPLLYQQYLKETPVVGSVTIKIKDN
jgi:hypothetical protein